MPPLIKLLQGASLALAFTATSANAGMIDFSDPTWAGAAGNNSYTVGGVTVTANPGRATLSHDSLDGLGVNYRDRFIGEPDEIDKHEMLSVNLGASTLIHKIVLHNLFSDECFIACWDERGEYRLDGGTWQSFTGNMAGQPGMLAIMVGSVAQTIDFRADRFALDDFSVKAIKAPEPGTLALMGLGLAGLGAFRRRKAQAAR